MPKYLRRITAVTGIFSFAAGMPLMGQTPAPGGHTHASPHGGDIVEVAEHHIEFKADSTGLIAVWVLDGKMKTMAPPAGASVTLIPPTGAQVTLTLQVETAAQRLTAHFDPAKYPSFRAVVSLMIAGTKRNLRYHYPGHH